jgi:hypothetical protein
VIHLHWQRNGSITRFEQYYFLFTHKCPLPKARCYKQFASGRKNAPVARLNVVALPLGQT